ncbi:hypothetical protein [Nonomuraea jabiensis]|uniref:hypothetical protein n=1 Tax=Nonomuraea jabiensis TaxID=882448 RepID=UPI0036AC1F0D
MAETRTGTPKARNGQDPDRHPQGPKRPRLGPTPPRPGAAETRVVISALIPLVRVGRPPVRKLFSHCPFDDIDRAAQGKAIELLITF